MDITKISAEKKIPNSVFLMVYSYVVYAIHSKLIFNCQIYITYLFYFQSEIETISSPHNGYFIVSVKIRHLKKHTVLTFLSYTTDFIKTNTHCNCVLSPVTLSRCLRFVCTEMALWSVLEYHVIFFVMNWNWYFFLFKFKLIWLSSKEKDVMYKLVNTF